MTFTNGAAGWTCIRSRWSPAYITPEVQETRTFTTMTGDLLRLADWLRIHR